MKKQIFLADDEANIRGLMKTFLENEGYAVETFENGALLMQRIAVSQPDLVILDIMMPGEDGFRICARIRKDYRFPIIIVSAKDSPLDRVNGIMLGSDDYLTKPFLPLELIARIKAIFRRIDLESGTAPLEQTLSLGRLRMEPAGRQAVIGSEECAFSPTEYRFLQYLLERHPSAVKKEELIRSVWNSPDTGDTRMIDDLLKRLRKKLREQNAGIRIETVWGYGYRLSEEDSL